jgi:hypothetical protein
MSKSEIGSSGCFTLNSTADRYDEGRVPASHEQWLANGKRFKTLEELWLQNETKVESVEKNNRIIPEEY